MPDWFIVNVADAPAGGERRSGKWVTFERDGEEFPHYGINIHVIEPGQPNGRYHSESAQEDFLILHGECIAIVEGEERHMKQWDFLHCPPGTHHILVGAGDGPCAILMTGARGDEHTIHYPVSELAAKYDASSKVDTDSPPEAYADWNPRDFKQGIDFPWPLG
jgi:uncharacterized cupin superfamily protein